MGNRLVLYRNLSLIISYPLFHENCEMNLRIKRKKYVTFFSLSCFCMFIIRQLLLIWRYHTQWSQFRRSGAGCRTVSVTRRSASIVVEGELISTPTVSLSTHSAVEMLYDSALDKFTIDIDVDIILFLVVCRFYLTTYLSAQHIIMCWALKYVY